LALHVQLLWGSLYLAISLTIHIGFLAATIDLLRRMNRRFGDDLRLRHIVPMLLVALVVIVASLTVQVWLWAWVLIGFDQLADWNSAIYFSLVTYTSLGYGDVVLEPASRIFGAFASVTGLLTFGLSTAFLVALMNRALRRYID
jgi:ion channel